MPDTVLRPPLSDAARRALWAWSALAIGALGMAGVFALLLALSRTPIVGEAIPWPAAFFGKGLVIHVVFSFVAWFLAVFAALLELATWQVAHPRPRLEPAGRLAAAVAAAAAAMLLAPAFLDRGEPTLNNYVPAIIDPLYYAGLIALAAAVAAMVVRLLVNLPGRARPIGAFPFVLAASGVTYLIALACFALAYARLAGQAPSYAFNEYLFWGGGHVLQFVNAGMLIAAWARLAAIAAPGGAPMGDRLLKGAAAWLVLTALAAPALYAAFDAFSGAQSQAFTDLQYALAPPLIAAAAAAAWACRGAGVGALAREPAALALALSFVVIGFGGTLGFFVDGADTRTPAHYHGVIAGINLAFMGLFLRLILPLLGRAPRGRRLLLWQLWLFGAGQTVAAVGLFLAGGFGAPRKTAGAAQGLDEWGAIAGMALNGIGALVAIAGGVLFIVTVAAALLRARRENSPECQGVSV